MSHTAQAVESHDWWPATSRALLVVILGGALIWADAWITGGDPHFRKPAGIRLDVLFDVMGGLAVFAGLRSLAQHTKDGIVSFSLTVLMIVAVWTVLFGALRPILGESAVTEKVRVLLLIGQQCGIAWLCLSIGRFCALNLRAKLAKSWRIAGFLLGLAALMQTYALAGEVFFGLDWFKGSPNASPLVRRVESSMGAAMFFSMPTYLCGFGALIASWVGHWTGRFP